MAIVMKPSRSHWKTFVVTLILAMHGLGLYFLLLPARQFKQAADVTFMMLVPSRPPLRALPLPMPRQAPLPRAAARAPAAVLPAAPPTVLADAAAADAAPAGAAPADAHAGIQNPELPPAQADDLRTRARLAAGAIDKTLRAELKQDKPWLAAPEPARETRFRQLLASAYQGGPPLRIEDYLMADGRPASRLVTAAGARCYAMAANPGAGADPFKSGGKLQQVPCP